ncbi:YdcF family protein [Micromonospora sp. CPCC 206060]|uniref:YdcF family protein n=1 Tax=Micromonospora sp. CPCC 206060 TaxID=3122406 RepID=UPI002FF43320
MESAPVVRVTVVDPAAGRSQRFLVRADAGPATLDPAAQVALDADDPAAGGLTLELDTATVEEVRGGLLTGSQAVMSGRVRIIGGAWADLNPVATAALHQGTPPGQPGVPAGPDVVAVLGAPNDVRGNLSVMAAGRTTHAAVLAGRTGAALVLTGGTGRHFNPTGQPHWVYCRDHLARRDLLGVPVLACLDSRHTYEDLLLLREVTTRHRIRSTVLVTSDYHEPRVRYLAGLVLPGAVVHGISHPELTGEHLARLRAHERTALGQVVAAALLFGPDRLLAPPARTDLGWAVRWTP